MTMLTGLLTKAAQDVLAERARQVSHEGWTAKHDDAHDDGELERAAAAYLLTGSEFPVLVPLGKADVPIWPWDIGYYKPKGRRADLVRAVALGLAAIERMDRHAQRTCRHSNAVEEGDGAEVASYRCPDCGAAWRQELPE